MYENWFRCRQELIRWGCLLLIQYHRWLPQSLEAVVHMVRIIIYPSFLVYWGITFSSKKKKLKYLLEKPFYYTKYCVPWLGFLVRHVNQLGFVILTNKWCNMIFSGFGCGGVWSCGNRKGGGVFGVVQAVSVRMIRIFSSKGCGYFKLYDLIRHS